MCARVCYCDRVGRIVLTQLLNVAARGGSTTRLLFFNRDAAELRKAARSRKGCWEFCDAKKKLKKYVNCVEIFLFSVGSTRSLRLDRSGTEPTRVPAAQPDYWRCCSR